MIWAMPMITVTAPAIARIAISHQREIAARVLAINSRASAERRQSRLAKVRAGERVRGRQLFSAWTNSNAASCALRPGKLCQTPGGSGISWARWSAVGRATIHQAAWGTRATPAGFLSSHQQKISPVVTCKASSGKGAGEPPPPSSKASPSMIAAQVTPIRGRCPDCSTSALPLAIFPSGIQGIMQRRRRNAK